MAFGASISGGGHKPKSIASVRKSQSGSVSSHVSNQLTTPQSRMQVMFRDSEEEKLEQIVFDEGDSNLTPWQTPKGMSFYNHSNYRTYVLWMKIGLLLEDATYVQRDTTFLLLAKETNWDFQ